MLRKTVPVSLQYNYEVDYQGFWLPDLFVIGLGLDYNEHFRDLPYLAVISDYARNTYRK
jgi:hypoxanthine phosphoribosyltransferase